MQDPVEVVAGCAGAARLALVARPEAAHDRAAEALDRGRGEHALGRAADAPEQVDAGAVAHREQRAGDVAVRDEADARAGAANALDHLVVPRAVEDHDHQVADGDAALVGDPPQHVLHRILEREEVGDVGAAGHLLHVHARARVEHRALLGDRDDRERVRHAAGDERRALERIDRDVDARAGAVADVLAVVEHGRLVLLALADHDDAVHRDGVEHGAHGVDGRLVGGDLVAGARPARGGERGGLGHTYELEGEVAIGHRCVHGAGAYTAGLPWAPMTPVTSQLDLTAIRARFPALAAREDGRLVSYLDGPGGSQVPREVLDAMLGYLERDNANLGGAFRASRASDDVMEAGRRRSPTSWAAIPRRSRSART